MCHFKTCFFFLNDLHFKRKATILTANNSDSECSSRQKKKKKHSQRVITAEKPHIRVMVCHAALPSAIGRNMIDDHFVAHWRPEISPVSFRAQLRRKRCRAANGAAPRYSFVISSLGRIGENGRGVSGSTRSRCCC